jgi:hypothetical protein
MPRKKKENKPVDDIIKHLEETFKPGKSILSPYQKKRADVSKMTCIEIPEEHLWIFTKHPEKKDELIKKYKNRGINSCKFEDK